MDIVLQTNIFFYITSIAVIVVTVLLVVALFYLIAIIRNVKEISDRLRKGTEILSEDIGEFRDNVKRDGMRFMHVVRFIGKAFRSANGNGKRKKNDH